MQQLVCFLLVCLCRARELVSYLFYFCLTLCSFVLTCFTGRLIRFYSHITMQVQEMRKPSANLMSVEVFREENGHWVSQTYSRWDWVLLRPSSRGHYRVKKKDIGNINKQWKGRIMAFRPLAPHSSKVEMLIQHVYMHKELALSKNQALGHKPNSKYLSICLSIAESAGVKSFM